MAKTYKKISGTWYPVKKLFQKIAGTWRPIKYLYKKISGLWKPVYVGAYEYTISQSSNYINLANLFGQAILNEYTEFVITIPAGVSLVGNKGTTGGTGGVIACSKYATSYSGGQGGNGTTPLDLTGMTGKTLTFINQGTVKGGDGGNGGTGGAGCTYSTGCYSFSTYPTYGGAGGLGGAGAVPIINNGNIIYVQGNPFLNGNTGATGATGASGYWRTGMCSCFPIGTQVLMADYTYKNIEDVKIGEFVMGMDGLPDLVQSDHIVTLGKRRVMWEFEDNSLQFSGEHPFWVRKDNEDWWGVCDIHQHIREDLDEPITNEHRFTYNVHHLHKLPFILIGDEDYAHTDGWKKQNPVVSRDKLYTEDFPLYSLVTKRTHSFIANGYVVSAFAHDTGDTAYDYSQIKWNGLAWKK